MDYYVELADHLDIEEALRYTKKPDGVTFEPEGVPRRGSIIQSFYRYPNFAGDVWFQLRYCCEYRRRLIEEICCVLEDAAFGWRGQYRYSEQDVKEEGPSTVAKPFWTVFKTDQATLDSAKQFLTETVKYRDQFVRQLQLVMTPHGQEKSDPARNFVDRLMESAENGHSIRTCSERSPRQSTRIRAAAFFPNAILAPKRGMSTSRRFSPIARWSAGKPAPGTFRCLSRWCWKRN